MTNTPLHSSNNVCTAAESLKRRSKARVAGSECMVCKCTAPAITGVAVWQLPQGTSQVGLYVQLIQAEMASGWLACRLNCRLTRTVPRCWRTAP